MREISKVAGWTFASLLVAGWAAGVASLAALECVNDCPPSPFPGVVLFVVAPFTMACASSLLAHGYGPEGGPATPSTPAAMAAKVVKLLGFGVVLLLLASPLLAALHPVAAGVAIAIFGPLSWVILRSARYLDRVVTPARLSPMQCWGVATALVLAAILLTFAAA